MAPLLQPGQQVLLHPGAYRRRPPRVGDIVVARHPLQPELKLVKRVVAVLDDGRVALRGDNAGASSDSRAFGPLPPAHILGRVSSRFPARQRND